MAKGNYAKEFDTVEELDKFLKGADDISLINAIHRPGQYTVTKCGTRRKFVMGTGAVDVYYVIGWEVPS